jgi:hypothetical protein
MKVNELKAECKKLGLKVRLLIPLYMHLHSMLMLMPSWSWSLSLLQASGKKTDLLARLLGATSARYRDLSLADLQEICASRNIDSSGTAEEIIGRLEADEGFTDELSASEKEKAAVAMPKKYFTFRIKSLEMKPIDFTPKGKSLIPHSNRFTAHAVAGICLRQDPRKCRLRF